jgi:hypothetical protein
MTIHRAYNDAVRRLGAREDVRGRCGKAFDGKEHLFYDTMHTECEGNDVFAAILAEFVAKRGSGRGAGGGGA